jgi:hypothetical protein
MTMRRGRGRGSRGIARCCAHESNITRATRHAQRILHTLDVNFASRLTSNTIDRQPPCLCKKKQKLNQFTSNILPLPLIMCPSRFRNVTPLAAHAGNIIKHSPSLFPYSTQVRRSQITHITLSNSLAHITRCSHLLLAQSEIPVAMGQLETLHQEAAAHQLLRRVADVLRGR